MTRDNVQEPVGRIRRELNLTQAELATICGISGRTVAAVEEGSNRSVPRKILDALAGLGYDPGAIQEEYDAYSAQHKADLLERLKLQKKE